MNVLLVEDNVVLGDAVRDHVCAKGHSVEWCLTLADATAAADTGHYGLVLLDLRLPDGSGLSLLRRLRTRQDAVPIIILTAHDQVSDQIGGLSCGATDYLVKPFGLSELDQRICAATDHTIPSHERGQATSGDPTGFCLAAGEIFRPAEPGGSLDQMTA